VVRKNHSQLACRRINSFRESMYPEVTSYTLDISALRLRMRFLRTTGPGSKPEGIEALKKAAAGMPRDSDIVLYCGCCPMTQCPNIRPAHRALQEMGFTHIRVLDIPTNVLDIPTNMATDWFGKGYPFEEGQPRPSN
jgi:hypothetical protein